MRAGTETLVEVESRQSSNLGGDVVRAVMNGRHAEVAGGVETRFGEPLVLVPDRDLVDPFLRSLAGAAEAEIGPRESLELERDVLENVCLVRSATQPLEEAPALSDAAPVLDHVRQPGHQPLVEARQLVRGRILELSQIDPRLQNRESGPDVGSAQGQNLPKLHTDRLQVSTPRGAEDG